jgi:ATP-binding cassette subfamily B protein
LGGFFELKRLLSFLRRYALRYWPWYAGGTFFLLATNWITVQIPLELAVAVDALGGDPAIIHRAMVRIAIMGASIMVVRTLSRVLFFTPGRMLEYRLKNNLFHKLLLLQPEFYARWKVGDIVSRVSNDVTMLRALVGFGGLQIFNVTAAISLAGAEMVRISPWLTFLAMAPIAVAICVVQLGLKRLFNLVLESQEALSDLSENVLSSLQGIPTIQGFNAEAAFRTRFLERNDVYLRVNLELAWVRALHMPLLKLAGGLSLAVLLFLGGKLTVSGALTIGELVAFTTYVGILLMPLRSLGWLLSVFQRGIASLIRIEEILDAVPERPEGKDGHCRMRAGGPTISLKNLNFAYPDDPNPVLQDISAEIPGGSTVGLFGRTGSGKTTLLRLIARCYNAPAGTISIDGIDVLSLDLDNWRRQMSVVPQVPFLFSNTIAENVALGDPQPERLKKAVEDAALGTDLDAFRDGLETLVGERGIMLSGGQRQRVALARGLYRDFDLLLLDDVLSAVDHDTEQRLIATLQARSQATREGRGPPTTLLVSHRVSAMRHADRILVLDGGRLVDSGSHQELVARGGPYRDAWLHQSRELQSQERQPQEQGP